MKSGTTTPNPLTAMSQDDSSQGFLQMSHERYTGPATSFVNSVYDVVDDKPESVKAEYGSDSNASISSDKPSIASTPASGSPISFATKVNSIGSWSNETECPDDLQCLTANSIQEAKAINDGYSRALENIKQFDITNEELSPADASNLPVALHRRHHNFDAALILNFIDEETRERNSYESVKPNGSYNYGAETKIWKGQRTAEVDIEKQDRTTRSNISRYNFHRFLQAMMLAFALGSVAMGYYWFWAKH